MNHVLLVAWLLAVPSVNITMEFGRGSIEQKRLNFN